MPTKDKDASKAKGGPGKAKGDKRPVGRPSGSGRKPMHPISVRLPVRLGDSLDRYIEDIEPKTSVTAVIELALRRYLESVGYYSPDPTD